MQNAFKEVKQLEQKLEMLTSIPKLEQHLKQSQAELKQKEADLKAGKISVTSPIGKGILGKKVGETAEVQAPAGTLTFRIDSITTG